MTDYTPKTADEARELVAAILERHDVAFTITYGGERVDPWANGDIKHKADAWSVVFSTIRGSQRVVQQFDFFTGLGLRTPAPAPNDGGPRPRPHTLMWGRLEAQRKPVAPHAADILHSLILDSSAVGQSFESWCEDYGYDSDSRKAESIYRACQQNADKLARIFDHAAREELREALQDY